MDYRAVGCILLAVVWVTLVNWVGLTIILHGDPGHRQAHPLGTILLQTVAVVPLAILWTNGLVLFRTSRWQYLAGTVALVVACAFLAGLGDLGWRDLLTRSVFLLVGPAEEFIFRGYIWEKAKVAPSDMRVVVTVSVGCFVVAHVPLVVLDQLPTSHLLGVAGFGVGLALLRWRTDGLFVPSAIHSLWDLLG